LPPGVFTDYTPVAPESTLNVLLVDALNTPQTDQIYLRQQLLDFIKRQRPGTNVAIFGLVNRLVMLQGFTTDPEILRTAVQHLDAKGSALLNDPIGTGIGPQKLSDLAEDHPRSGNNPGGGGAMKSGGSAQTAGDGADGLRQWEAEQAALKTHMRAQLTMDAFNSLAHYLSNFPGRKNLIWFSGSFPLQIEPDPSLPHPFHVVMDSNQEFQLATNLLAAAHTAVYPVDARGLMNAPTFDASQSGKRVSQATAMRGDVDAAATSERTFGEAQADEHITMDKIADSTGGHAFYNTNDLSEAVNSAIDAGSNYYTLTYTPTDHKWNTAFRNIHVEITGSSAKGEKLTYRRGYYADDPRRPPTRGEPAAEAALEIPADSTQTNSAAAAYSRAAISQGSPTPEDIIFKVQVLPVKDTNDDTLAPDNQADPHGRMKAPYRTFAVNFVAFPSSFSMALLGDGRHSGAIEFGIFVYDNEGNLLNVSDKEVSLLLPPDTYKEFVSNPVRLQLQVSAPAKQQSFLRLIVHDIPSNHYGAVEIPTAQVDHLAPLEAQSAPVDSAVSPNAGAPSQPSGQQ